MNTGGVEISMGITKNSEKQLSVHTELLYLVNGKLTITVEGSSYHMASDDILLVNAGEQWARTVIETGALCRIRFEPSLINELNSGKHSMNCSTCRNAFSAGEKGEKHTELRNKIQAMLYEYFRGGSQMSAGVVSQCFDILQFLMDNFSSKYEEAEDRGVDDRICDMVAYIRRNYASQVTLSELAARFYISDSHLSRIFKSALGMGFREFLAQVRLEAAEAELRSTGKSIIRIANDNGFSGLAAFNRSFKEKYGETPSTYRKNIGASAEKNITQDAAQEELAVDEFIARYEREKSLRESVRTVEVDADGAVPYVKPWKDCINFGAASDLLNPLVQKHILKLRDLLDFSYVRFWNIFLENFLYFPKAVGSKLHFSKLDNAIDFLLQNHLKPFIQFGPKPRTIVFSYSRQGTIDSLTERAGSDYIADMSSEEWEKLIDDIICHLVSKYGGQEMESWIYEMWSPCPWDGIWADWYSEEKFAAVYHAVRKYVPGAMVGGCEFTYDVHAEKFPQIADEWKRLGIDPDFISFSALPYEINRDDKGMVTIWHPETETLEKLVDSAYECMQANGFGDKKLFFTIWNITASNRNIINDSVDKGTYIIDSAISTLNGKADMLAYWMGTDAYAEGVDVRRILFGGTGLITSDDMAKPSLHAFIFLKKLRSQFLTKGPGYVVTRNKFGIYTVVYCNRRNIPFSAVIRDEHTISYEDISAAAEGQKTSRMDIIIYNVQNGVYNMRQQIVSSKSGSLLDEWHRLGAYEINAQEDKEYIASRAVPYRFFERIRVTDGKLILNIEAEKNEFGVIELEFQHGVQLG